MKHVFKNIGLVILVLVGFASIILAVCAVRKAVLHLFHPVDCSCCQPR